jgi:hypothetical protein
VVDASLEEDSDEMIEGVMRGAGREGVVVSMVKEIEEVMVETGVRMIGQSININSQLPGFKPK